jgi:Glu-tRNA(Gln) amidotransferase subunit E-like FAD-binding protein
MQNQDKKEKQKEQERKIEMKAGLEIHQQLDTGKLFCRCPGVLRNEKGDWIAHRKLHVVAGETGSIDLAAEHESKKAKEFIYEGFKDTNCLVEFDEQPPLEIDKEALKIACQIALLLNCEIIPVTQIMRKTVIDGSNTSGFQRTLLLAKNGFIETSFGRVGIQTICLEEDAARKIEENEKEGTITYRLDRLGIPLVEIATSPELYFPEQVKEAALKLGEILRSCKVKRGIGTIRQDLNISTPGHGRVEIKGFQDPAMMIITVEKEIERQKQETKGEDKKSKKKAKGDVRKANPDGTTEFLRPMPGADRMYPETDLNLLKISRDFINEIKKSLPKLKSDIRGELRQRGLSDEMIKLVLESGEEKMREFENMIKIYNKPNFVAKIMLVLPKEIASHENIKNIENLITIDIIETILQNIASGKIKEEDAKHVLEKISKGIKIDEALKVEKTDLSEIEGEIAKIIKEKPGLTIGAYMGLVMQRFKGKVSGKAASEIINKLMK